MSDQLQLSGPLIQELIQTIRKHDPKCDNEWVACQYLAATLAFVASRQNSPADQKEEILNEIIEFVRYVYNDTLNQQQAEQVAPPAADPSQAFGIWHPDGK